MLVALPNQVSMVVVGPRVKQVRYGHNFLIDELDELASEVALVRRVHLVGSADDCIEPL